VQHEGDYEAKQKSSAWFFPANYGDFCMISNMVNEGDYEVSLCLVFF
jgi:hypothetical protein